VVSRPTLIVQIGFSIGASTGTWLHLDDETRGLLDTGTLAPSATWEDVTSYVRSVSMRRGSSRVEGAILRYEAGTCSITLDNRDRRFDPANLAGPYVAGGVTQVTPMRAVRVQANWSGTVYSLWRGFVDAWQVAYTGPNAAEVTLTATDGMKVLGAYDRAAVAPVGAGERSGSRINRILTSAGWPLADRRIATGDSTVQATTLAGNALSELQLTADSELGELYIDGAGRVVFRNRLALLQQARSNTSQATFGDDAAGTELRYADVTIDYDDEQLVNLARIGIDGGTQQTAQDLTSQTTYLVHTLDRSDLLLETDADAADYAGFLIYTGKDPELRFGMLTLNPLRDPTGLFPHALARQIGDRITVRRRPPGGGDPIERDVFIRGITHDITLAGWRTSWTLQSASRFAFLTLDHSTLGVLDSNALAY
jgi:hypothetical protein